MKISQSTASLEQTYFLSGRQGGAVGNLNLKQNTTHRRLLKANSVKNLTTIGGRAGDTIGNKVVDMTATTNTNTNSSSHRHK